MPIGEGKYDEECTAVRLATAARAAAIIIVGGERGNGMSAQAEDVDDLEAMAKVLRATADSMERDVLAYRASGAGAAPEEDD